MTKELYGSICAIMSLLACGDAMAGRGKDLTSFMDPFVGTDETGHTSPAACVPLGMIQAGPDTGTEGWEYCGGYRYKDKRIVGFSQTHINGTGCGDLGDVRILPFVGTEAPAGLTYDKTSEKAEPGFYCVKLECCEVSVSATAHSAIYRIHYTKEGPRRLLIDCQWGIVSWGDIWSRVLSCETQVHPTGLSGVVRLKQWVERNCAFALEFDRPGRVVSRKMANDRAKAPCYILEFDGAEGDWLTVKIALSRHTEVEAKRNLAAEIPDWDFTRIRDGAREAWDRIAQMTLVEGSDDQKRNWYTALYHLYIQPNNIADVGERPFYSTFSCWDTFRAAGPLYTLLTPCSASDFVDSMLIQGKDTGFLPIWTLWGSDNQTMIGTHSIPMIVDAWLKGVWKGDVEAAYRQVRDTLLERHGNRTKENWDLYDKYGYYPFDKIIGESVSRTLECAYDDWCAGQMAKRLGKDADSAQFAKRAGYWKNVIDSSLGFARGRDSSGNWRDPFDPFSLGHGAAEANDFTEGNAFQYTWHVMHDPEGLIAALGGKAGFEEKLDSLFTQPTSTKGMGSVLDVTGLIGQYVHGNEPSHHVIYFYSLIGNRNKTAMRVRDVFDRFYRPTPDGLCGNDDCGQMSAWFLFSAMGFYPFNPCGGEYVLGAPQIPKVTLRLQSGREFVVVAKGLSRENKFVKSVRLNGTALDGCVIRHGDIVKGGTLEFEMSDAP